MKNYWTQLNNRERWMVALAVIVAVVYLNYILIFSPLKNAVDNKTKQLIEKVDTLKWMKKTKLQHHAVGNKKTLNNSQLLTLLADRLKEDELKRFPYQIQQTANGDIQLSFNEVPFNRLITWLRELNKQYAMSIRQLNAERRDTSGMVKLYLIISAS